MMHDKMPPSAFTKEIISDEFMNMGLNVMVRVLEESDSDTISKHELDLRKRSAKRKLSRIRDKYQFLREDVRFPWEI